MNIKPRSSFFKTLGISAEQGFSLTEIMVALLISSILMYGVMTIMSSGKRTHALQSELAGLYDNARFIMEDITYTLRMAGFKGCAGSADGSAVNPLAGQVAIGDNSKNDNNQSIAQTFTFGGTGTFPEFIKKSDKLRVRSLDRPLKWYDEDTYGPEEATQSSKLYLSADNNLSPLKKDAPVLVSDCLGSEVTRLKDVVQYEVEQDGSVTITKPYIMVTTLNRTYRKPIDIYVVETDPNNPVVGSPRARAVLYEIRWQNPDSTNKFGQFLFYKRINPGNDPPGDDEEPFIEGVENMQVRYGVQSGGGILYQDNTPTGSNRVVSVRVNLLMRTAKPRFDLGNPPAKEFRLDARLDPYNPNPDDNDALNFETGYRHRLFSSTINVRNN